ncbi:reverse transcriptase domain-containing protein [Tanacetum coccineum]
MTGLILTSPEGEEFTYALRYPTSGNKEGTVNQDQSKTIHHDQRRLIQKVVPRTMVAWKKQSGSDITGRQCTRMHGTSSENVMTVKPIGPFPEAQGKVRFLIVAIDYFTKWIEAKPIAMITGNQVKKFVWDNIVCRFGLPGEIISDNRKQFRDNPFKDWCEKLNIKQRFAFFKHPQTNGQVERANRSIREGIKARLGKDNKSWVEEVLHVLWAHRTMIKTRNRDTPFSLTYGTEAVISVEIGMPSLRCTEINQAENNEGLILNLNILEERREKAVICEAKSKVKMEKYYNAKVRSTAFRPGDFVYRSNEASHAKESGKLSPKWEGPYEVVETLGKGAYKLMNGSGDILPRTWNIKDLKKCYL